MLLEPASSLNRKCSEAGPISMLPTEILCDIFLLCRDSDLTISICPTYSPVLLKNICSYWRTIATNMPDLWSTLTIDADTLQLQSPTLLLSLFFHYSAPLPLDIRICTDWSYGILTRFDMIVPSISDILIRCKSLTITVSVWHRQVTSRLFPTGSNTDMPMLEKLKVYALVGRINAPHLRSLSTSGTAELPDILHSARNSVTFLGITGGIPTNETLAAISHFPNISELGLVLYETNNPPYPLVFSPSIKRLSITWLDTSNSNPIALLDYIDMPSLESLTLRASHGFIEDPQNHDAFNNVDIDAVIEQHNWDTIIPNLKSLHLTHVTMSLTYLRTFGGEFTFTRLEELVIIDCDHFAVVVQKLGDPAAFPALKSLTIQAANVRDFDDTAIPPVINDFIRVMEEKVRCGKVTFMELVFPPSLLSERDSERMQSLQGECRQAAKLR